MTTSFSIASIVLWTIVFFRLLKPMPEESVERANKKEIRQNTLKKYLTRNHIAADVSRMNRPRPYRGFDQ